MIRVKSRRINAWELIWPWAASGCDMGLGIYQNKQAGLVRRKAKGKA
jgi:hypothetical protein